MMIFERMHGTRDAREEAPRHETAETAESGSRGSDDLPPPFALERGPLPIPPPARVLP